MTGATDCHRDDQDNQWIEARAALILRRLPASVRVRALWFLDRWPGRVLARSARQFMRLEMFDRSMTIAAQFFTSIVPILILLSTWGAGSGLIMDAVEMPETSRAAVESAVQGAGASAFGIVGVMVVLVSATSLSRALARALSAIWSLPRPRSRLGAAWRWLVVLLVLVLFLVGTRIIDGTLDVLPLETSGHWLLACCSAWRWRPSSLGCSSLVRCV
ncbi:YhjD/YihY/BrkB family envelope integrity protein [Nocardioides alcanivorans]|uniref:YhjD/YihY/BrkB family envelope integrity protein n=1 Tax=Nocardioides alcanivorans TaxID=2897352 RepID=UPI001F486162|nr:YhjD/YihY/BrkB family envelope integrity protein [Nocardioides alcanivorans]